MLLILVIVVLGSYLLLNGKNIAVLNPQGIIADKQMSLMIFTTLLGMVVVVPVWIMLFLFAYRYRASNTKAKYTPDVEGNRFIETLWWGIPIIIILVLSVVTWFSSHDLDPYKQLQSDKKAITIRVVAMQWKWLFIYPGQGVASVNEVRFPAGTPVNFELTGDAPMSAFWIPNLGSQVYAMNGMVSKLSLQADNEGEFPGSNTNISGEGYATMKFKAIATSQEDFDRWVGNVTESENHMTWQVYGELAKPSKANQVTYYHLHDADVFDKIVAKYMDHDQSATETDDSATIEEQHEHEYAGEHGH